jgi:hypothetical protein
METLSDRLRHADRTLTKLREMPPGERKLAVTRLVKMRDELEIDRDELDAAINDEYDELTVERSEKYPDMYERRFGDWHKNVAQYEAVCNRIAEIDRAIEKDRGVNNGEGGEATVEAAEEAPRYGTAALPFMDRRTG